MPRPRFTLRRLMLAVAVAALVMAIAQVHGRVAEFARLSAFHANMTRTIRRYIDSATEEFRDGAYHFTQGRNISWRSDRPNIFGYDSAEFPDGFNTLEGWKRLAMWHRDLYLKYEHAASKPWLSVAPDPPKPE